MLRYMMLIAIIAGFGYAYKQHRALKQDFGTDELMTLITHHNSLINIKEISCSHQKNYIVAYTIPPHTMHNSHSNTIRNLPSNPRGGVITYLNLDQIASWHLPHPDITWKYVRAYDAEHITEFKEICITLHTPAIAQSYLIESQHVMIARTQNDHILHIPLCAINQLIFPSRNRVIV